MFNLALMGKLLGPGLLQMVGALSGQARDEYPWPAEMPRTVRVFAQQTDAYLSWLEERGFCGVVLMAEKGAIILHKAYGYADRDRNRRMTISTGFDIGSIVKPITKAAIVRLASEGRLSLNDPLSRFFGEVPADKADITIQHVLDYKAGFLDIFGGDYEPATRDSVVQKTLTAQLISKPGETFNYSNAGYSVLGAVIEKLSGSPYERFVYDQVLAPSGVKRIGYPYQPPFCLGRLTPVAVPRFGKLEANRRLLGLRYGSASPSRVF